MSEVTQQEIQKNQVEDNHRQVLENEMLGYARNFEVKRLGKAFFNYFDFSGEEFLERYQNKGKKYDKAFVKDFNVSRKLTDVLRPHLINNYGFETALDFKSFKIISGSHNHVYSIDKKGKEHQCFGIDKDEKPNIDTDTVTIKYSQNVSSEPKYLLNNGQHDCKEMFELTKKTKHGMPQKIILRQYQINGKQYVTYDWLLENEKKEKKPINYSKIKS